MAALTNAQRQRRWRERYETGDLLPPLSANDFSPLLARFAVILFFLFLESCSLPASMPLKPSETALERSDIVCAVHPTICGNPPAYSATRPYSVLVSEGGHAR
jgi:hypothetical protein